MFLAIADGVWVPFLLDHKVHSGSLSVLYYRLAAEEPKVDPKDVSESSGVKGDKAPKSSSFGVASPQQSATTSFVTV